MIDSESLKKGKNYDQMPDVHIIYISETDLWKSGKTIYRVEKKLDGTENIYDVGVYITYVIAEILEVGLNVIQQWLSGNAVNS
ncbi:MAG: hypothetical protein HFG93_03055 [Dorea sp.]|jgi:hypothetical protein|nr:hypothetical protein [Dorea sp.]